MFISLKQVNYGWASNYLGNLNTFYEVPPTPYEVLSNQALEKESSGCPFLNRLSQF